jgi:hypothetical protein
MEAASKSLCCFKKLDYGHSLSKKIRLCQITSVMLCSLFWDSWPLKTGRIGCLEMQLTNYHCMLCNISEECRSYGSIWRRRPWFDWAWSGSDRSGLMRYSSALHTEIEDDLTYLSAGFKEKTLSCIWVNTVVMVFITNTESYLKYLVACMCWGQNSDYRPYGLPCALPTFFSDRLVNSP